MVLRKHELESKLGEESHLIKTGVLRDDNPLEDNEDFNDFLLACRHGDLQKCQEYINLGININGKDKFDYTALIIVGGMQSRPDHHFFFFWLITAARRASVAIMN